MANDKLQKQVAETFKKAFGYTPLSERLKDIQGEFMELNRWRDVGNIREEAGDLMASLIALSEECGWDYQDLVRSTLAKIEHRMPQYSSLGRKLKVAILGGAFNPITKGHIAVAKFVLDTSGEFDEVWVMPCMSHMNGKVLESAEHRLAMCNIAAEVDRRIKVSDYEIRNGLSGETYFLVKRMLADPMFVDRVDASFIIGQDNANTFDKWVNYEHLERLVRFVVVPRVGVEPDPNVTWYRKPPHIVLVPEKGKHNFGDVSSTMVREAIKELSASDGLDTHWIDRLYSLLDVSVLNYIFKHGLYGAKGVKV